MNAAVSDRLENMLGWLEVSPSKRLRDLSEEEWQRKRLELLNRTLRHAGRNVPFYWERLPKGAELALGCVEDLRRLPFTTPEDLIGGWERFLGAPLRDIRRMVTLFSSGSTGQPKRIGFTEEDLLQTVRFFQYGMQELMEPGEKAMICLPGTRENSITDLLSDGIRRFGGVPLVYGSIDDPADAEAFLDRERPRCVVAIPGQMAALAGHLLAAGRMGCGSVRAMLLTTDYVPGSVRERVERAFGCRVHNHYGATEMGYGGALECRCGGMHLRGNDLLAEIVDPVTGQPLPHGQEGELVITTLGREGMPLIRYRTGDMASIAPGRCDCGSPLPRLTPPRRREGCQMTLPGGILSLHRLDEVVFSFDEAADFQADYDENRGLLRIALWLVPGADGGAALLHNIRTAVEAVVPGWIGVRCDVAQADATRPSLLGKRTLGSLREGPLDG